jgi:hypothetical protein
MQEAVKVVTGIIADEEKAGHPPEQRNKNS